MKDEEVSRKVGRLGSKIRVAKRKEREEEVALEGWEAVELGDGAG